MNNLNKWLSFPIYLLAYHSFFNFQFPYFNNVLVISSAYSDVLGKRIIRSLLTPGAIDSMIAMLYLVMVETQRD